MLTLVMDAALSIQIRGGVASLTPISSLFLEQNVVLGHFDHMTPWSASLAFCVLPVTHLFSNASDDNLSYNGRIFFTTLSLRGVFNIW